MYIACYGPMPCNVAMNALYGYQISEILFLFLEIPFMFHCIGRNWALSKTIHGCGTSLMSASNHAGLLSDSWNQAYRKEGEEASLVARQGASMASRWSAGLVALLSISMLVLQAGSQGSSSGVPEINSSVSHASRCALELIRDLPCPILCHSHFHAVRSHQRVCTSADSSSGTRRYRRQLWHIAMHADGPDSCWIQAEPAHVHTYFVRRHLPHSSRSHSGLVNSS